MADICLHIEHRDFRTPVGVYPSEQSKKNENLESRKNLSLHSISSVYILLFSEKASLVKSNFESETDKNNQLQVSEKIESKLD